MRRFKLSTYLKPHLKCLISAVYATPRSWAQHRHHQHVYGYDMSGGVRASHVGSFPDTSRLETVARKSPRRQTGDAIHRYKQGHSQVRLGLMKCWQFIGVASVMHAIRRLEQMLLAYTCYCYHFDETPRPHIERFLVIFATDLSRGLVARL